MKDKTYFQATRILVRLLIILGLIGMPSAGWGQVNTEDQNLSEIRANLNSQLNALQTPNSIWKVQTVQYQDEWGIAIVIEYDPNTDRPVPASPMVAIANKVDGVWHVVTPEQDDQISQYNTWLDEIPESLIPESQRPPLRISSTDHLVMSSATNAVSGYKLPWGKDIKGHVVRVHNGAQIDFDIQGGGTSGIVVAAKGGIVKFRKDSSNTNCPYNDQTQSFACSWQYTNLIVVEHASNEYSWYMHLAPGTIPSEIQEGKPVSQGQKLGVEGTTGWSTGVHLHFHVATSYSCCTGTNDLRVPNWPSSFYEVNFDECDWNCIKSGGEKTSQNSGSGGSSPQCTDSGNPNGNYDQPSNNQRVAGSVTLKGWARDDCGVDAVEFTATWPGQGWHVVKRIDNDCSQGQTCSYEHNWNLSNVPGGAIVTLGYDIFDKSGKVSRSPNGTRNILKLGSCPQPHLYEPAEKIYENHTHNFRWSALSDCDLGGGYTLRIRTNTDMYSTASDSTVLDTGVGETQRQVTIDTRWDDLDLFWSVKAVNGNNWASPRLLRLTTNRLPTISFNTANGNSASEINTREQNWTFTGTANDPENKLSKIEFHCHGDACNDDIPFGNNSNWSYTRNGLTGENRVWFTVCDDKQCRDSEKRLLLRIDLALPTSTADANGQSNPTEWFRGAVDVKLRAQDGATGNAQVGVGEIRYKVDGGGWQSHGGDNKTVTVSGDGLHTVEYYAIDKVGNEETSHKTIRFKIDATPPGIPGAASESGGAINNQWQKSVSTPNFTWSASNDNTSGLQHYEMYFGSDANSDQIQSFVAANAQRSWTPLPNGVRTGTYYLRARARDNAGNYSAWSTLFTFRFDNTAPPNPTSASHAAKLISESWQRTTSSANFTWTVPSDEGSGVKGYYIYWGDQQNGTVSIPGALVTGASYQSAGALCSVGQVCTGYLRIRTVDNVDNMAGDWSNLFTVRYDGAAPTLNFSFNGGVTQTAQTLVTLNLDAHDEPGSGVRNVRSFANSTWSAWEPYQSERSETIPAIGRQEWPVYVQVRDAVGWESTVVSKSVYFEVNRPQPKSANYWLFDGIFNAGNGSHISTNYKLKSSVGQSLDSEPLLSASYIISGGYQAASMAIPLQVPGHDEFNHISGVFASGIVNDTTASSNYRMLSSIGQMGLPDNAAKGTIVSSNYQLRPGFLAASPSVIASPTPPPSPTPGPTPTPEPPKGCEFATLTINNGALFTNNPNVSLNLCAPAAQEMIVSNDGSFSGATWEPFKTGKAWTLTTLGQNVVARLVQARFKDEAGNSYHYAVDDIIYDPTAPSGDIAINDPIPVRLLMQMNAVNTAQDLQIQASAAMESFKMGSATYLNRLGERRFDEPVQLLSPAAAGALNVYLIAQDDNSGLQEMQIGEQANLGNAAWQPYDGLIAWTPSSGDGEKQLYARFRDSAGNASTFYSSTVVIDSHPPLGGINILEDIIGANTVNMHLYLGAEDNLSGVSAIRISHNPSFVDAPWQPFAAEITWPIQISATENEKTIYAQFRDAAGNVSQTYSDITIIDRQPPLVYAEVEVSDAQERQIDLYAYDELSALSTVRLSNDPLMSQGVVTMPYSDTVRWTFDDRRVVWIQVEDAVGNRSEGYPSYAPLLTDPTPSDKRVYLPLINR